ncbi:MAG TPA: NAD(P)H-hydrate epimerase [Pirellulales bacterium]
MVRFTRRQAREFDRRAVEVYGMPSLLLMENAAAGAMDVLCAAAALSAGRTDPVVICCGGGNNGGDGFAIARRLDARGVPVRVLAWCDPAKLPPDARVNYDVLVRAGLPLVHPAAGGDFDLAAALSEAAWIVDALLGTGARGEPREPISGVIDAINASGKKVLAVDLPSGLDADTGAAAVHTTRATITCTFAAEKRGFAEPGTKPYLGEVKVVDLGAPGRLLGEIAASPE